MLIRLPSLFPTLTACFFACWSFRVTLMSSLLRCWIVIVLWTSLRIFIRTSISNYPLSPSAFSIFGCIVIIYPVVVL